MAQNYYQKEIETMSREEMHKLQSEKLVKQVKHVYENVPYYRDLMDKKGVKPEDIHGIELCLLCGAHLPRGQNLRKLKNKIIKRNLVMAKSTRKNSNYVTEKTIRAKE